jgi:NAD(P)-dependent dehydrogenase (short-subunit alcohol dehydrogenase family)
VSTAAHAERFFLAGRTAVVVGLTKALANEWSTAGVNVNAIAPGYIATENTAPLRENSKREAAIHGHTLVVDGGWIAR